MQIFSPRMNTIARVGIIAVLLGVALLAWIAIAVDRSPYVTRQNVPINQPVLFSHQHHVADLGIDCRYCHTSVDVAGQPISGTANMPPTETCMTCHSQIWTGSPLLAPVRESFRTGIPLQWNRVYDLPDYVYFDHGIHVQKGVACVTCHGRVDQMALTYKAQPLEMSWCINCHRAPEQYIRPRDQVFSMDWQPTGDQLTLGRRLVQEYHIAGPDLLTSCSTCHH